MVVLLTLVACADQFIVEKGDTAVGSDGTTDTVDTAPDTSMWDGARLLVTSPASGDFLPYQESSTFSAEVLDAEGNVTDFDDITWSSDIDAAWALTGTAVQDSTLDVGTHALTATAELPNGDRLAYTVGGILVQSAYTGIYTGTLSVDATGDYNGTSYSAGCSGALTLVVDAYGQTAAGDAGCLISLLGYDLDTSYVFDLDNSAGDLSGSTALDLVYYQLDIDTTGSITEDGALEGTFSDDVYGFLTLDGSFDGTRVSRDISDYTAP